MYTQCSLKLCNASSIDLGANEWVSAYTRARAKNQLKNMRSQKTTVPQKCVITQTLVGFLLLFVLDTHRRFVTICQWIDSDAGDKWLNRFEKKNLHWIHFKMVYNYITLQNKLPPWNQTYKTSISRGCPVCDASKGI